MATAAHPESICAVVPTHNCAQRIPELLTSLSKQSLAPDRFEVVVVDDSSTDGTWELLTAHAWQSDAAYQVMRTPRNSGGPTRPRNMGWRASTADVIAFLDDDCIPDPEWLAAGLAAMAADPSLGVLQGKTVPDPNFDLGRVAHWDVVRWITGPTPWFEATNIFYRRLALEQVGGFDERLVWRGEDTDLGWKVVEAGWKRGFCDQAVGVHEVWDRGWRWAAKFGWLDRRTVLVAAAHPQIREQGFWRPWALHREPAELALALIGLAGSIRWRPLAILIVPYLVDRLPPIQRPTRFLRWALENLAVDVVSLAGHVMGSLEARILVL